MIGRPFRVATIRGIPLKVDLSWVFIVSLLTLSLAVSFSRDFPYLNWLVWLSMGLAASMFLFGSVLAHELSHAFVAIRHGIAIRGITLFIFGGAAEMSDETPNAAVELRVALAGPAMSLALAVGFGAVWTVGLGWLPAPVMTIVQYLALMNGILVAFNVVPGFPLDGGRVLRATLWGLWGDLRAATQAASTLGSGFGFLLMLLGFIYVFPIGNVIYGVWYMFIGLFLRSAARTSFQQVLVRDLLKSVRAGDLMSRDVVSVGPQTTLEQIVQGMVLVMGKAEFPVVGEAGRLLGLVGLPEIRGVDRSQWAQVTAGDVMRGDALRRAVSEADEAMRVLFLTRDEDGLIPVVDGETLVGVITKRELMRRLRLRMELNQS